MSSQKFCERNDLTDVGLPGNACDVALVDVQGRERIQHTCKRSFALIFGYTFAFSAQTDGFSYHLVSIQF